MKIVIGCMVVALCSGVGYAQTAPAAGAGQGLRYFVGLDLGGGGETLVDLQFTNGNTESIKTGGGPQAKGGLEYRFGPTSAVRASFGYEYDNVSGVNGEATFSRRPVEVMGMWNFTDNVRLGLGLRYVTGAKFTSSGDIRGLGRFELGSSPGPVLETEYLYGPWYTTHLGFSFRMVGDRYHYGDTKVNGNHFAIGANYYF